MGFVFINHTLRRYLHKKQSSFIILQHPSIPWLSKLLDVNVKFVLLQEDTF